MTQVSRSVVINLDGVPTILAVDANIFGTGTVAQRPASGNQTGDLYIVQDAPLYAFDIWNGAAWVRTTVVGPSGGSVDNRVVRWNGTGGDTLQNSGVTLNDTDQLSGLTTATFAAEFNAGSSGGAGFDVDWNDGQKQLVTLTGDAAFTFTNPPGATNVVLRLVQDATGNRNPTWASNIFFPNGNAPNLSNGATDIDLLSFYFDGTNYHGASSLNFGAT